MVSSCFLSALRLVVVVAVLGVPGGVDVFRSTWLPKVLIIQLPGAATTTTDFYLSFSVAPLIRDYEFARHVVREKPQL